jgi:hypothetical protein
MRVGRQLMLRNNERWGLPCQAYHYLWKYQKNMIELWNSIYRYLFIPIVNLSPHPQTTRYFPYLEKLWIQNCLSIFPPHCILIQAKLGKSIAILIYCFMYIVVNSIRKNILRTSAYSKYHYLQLSIHTARIYSITVHEI